MSIYYEPNKNQLEFKLHKTCEEILLLMALHMVNTIQYILFPTKGARLSKKKENSSVHVKKLL